MSREPAPELVLVYPDPVSHCDDLSPPISIFKARSSNSRSLDRKASLTSNTDKRIAKLMDERQQSFLAPSQLDQRMERYQNT
jgi:hypothetical protein